MAKDLNQLNVIITRPIEQARGLEECIRSVHGNPILFPTLVIAPCKQNPLDLQTVQFDYVIFTSRNAVVHFEKIGKLPLKTRIVAMGPATALALKERGVEEIICPKKGFSSEELLLQLQTSHLSEKKILLITGQGGRTFLEEQLQKQGAEVTKRAVYERQLPKIKECEIDSIVKFAERIIVSTSCESLNNLKYIMQNYQKLSWLLNTPVLVISDRMFTYALDLGFKSNCLIKALNATDNAILDCLIKWYAIC